MRYSAVVTRSTTRSHETREVRPACTEFSWWHATVLIVAGVLLPFSLNGCDVTAPADELPHLSIADADPEEEGSDIEFAVTLSTASEVPVTARYVTEDDTARAGPGNDYTHASGSVTFAPGELEQIIVVRTLKDDVEEANREAFTVRLIDAENASLGDDAVASGTILDSDDSRAKAMRIQPGIPISGRLETGDDVDYFVIEMRSSGAVIAATDGGRVGSDPRYLRSVVTIEGGSAFSLNDDNVDVARIRFRTSGTIDIYIRVSSHGPTPYDLFIWVLDERAFPWIFASGAESFDIELRYLGSKPTAAQRQTFRQAAEVWERAITRGLPDQLIASSAITCDDGDPSLFGTHVDDLLVYTRLERIDGPGGALAEAGPCWSRGERGLPFIGTVTIDTADLSDLESKGALGSVFTHELAHALGFGTIWHLVNPSIGPDGVEVPGQDTHFSGPAAVAAFNAAGGRSYTGGAKVPVENDTERYGVGGLDGHWRESVFADELLTSSLSIDPGSNEPLSIVTVAALRDLGYSVDYTAAQQYTLPAARPGTARAVSSHLLHLHNDVRQAPVRAEDALDQSLDVILALTTARSLSPSPATP